MSLSSCLGRPSCRQLLKHISAAEASDKQEMERLCTKYNEHLVAQVNVTTPANLGGCILPAGRMPWEVHRLLPAGP